MIIEIVVVLVFGIFVVGVVEYLSKQ